MTALWAAVAALSCLAAAPAAAAAPADASSLPQISQTLSGGDGGSPGCTKASTATTGRTPWDQSYLGVAQAWAVGQGAGVTVAVLGSGVDGASGVFGDRLALGPREDGTGSSGRDCVGQGTFVAGLIAAGQQDGTGFAGIAPQARILAVAVTDDSGRSTPAALAAGIRAAVDGGARVIDLAVTVPAPAPALLAAVDYAAGRGALVVAPATADPDPSATDADPDGGPAAGAAYPAAYPGVLSVSDLGPGGAPPQPAAGTTAPAVRVDLVAPGDSVLSVGPGGRGYFTGTGPSFAAAVVAGTAALVLGAHPELTAQQLVRQLEDTAYHPGTALPDAAVGYGTVDPVAAVSAPLPQQAAGTPSARPARLAMPAPADPTADHDALALAAGALAVVLLTGAAALVLPRGNRRRWRPGVWPGHTGSAEKGN